MLVLLINIVVVTLVGALVLFLRNNGKLDKRTLRYGGIFALVALLTGAIMWVLYDRVEVPIFNIFLIALAVFLLAGYFHAEEMFDLLWAQRDTANWSRDSFLKEISFTFRLSAIMTLLCLALFGYLIQKWEVAASMWGLLLLFPLPLILVKTYDFLVQIPIKDFDKKWFYEIFPFDETQWKRENMVSIGFKVADSIKHEKQWFHTKARFSIVIPRDQELRVIYRLALREYHKKKPSVPVQELGYEENIPRFWWLFYVPFVLWKPSTWRRKNYYLDPN